MMLNNEGFLWSPTSAVVSAQAAHFTTLKRRGLIGVNAMDWSQGKGKGKTDTGHRAALGCRFPIKNPGDFIRRWEYRGYIWDISWLMPHMPMMIWLVLSEVKISLLRVIPTEEWQISWIGP